ncbi:hypothetical protein WJX72_007098 [[Myrmecia] bisecta]|uniref:Uncharacterized protein n=1 Tax=[Myrmecia] bisecta TaxID=41462 RepID=A0AAW1P4P2_9CHLO
MSLASTGSATVTPLSKLNQVMFQSSVTNAINSAGTSGVALANYASAPLVNVQSVTILGEQDLTTTSCLLAVRITAWVYNGASLAETYNTALASGAVKAWMDGLNMNQAPWTTSLKSMGNSISTSTTPTSSSPSGTVATNQCKTKYGAFCLDKSGLSKAAVQGIIAGGSIGIILGCAIAALTAWCCIKKRNERKAADAKIAPAVYAKDTRGRVPVTASV